MHIGLVMECDYRYGETEESAFDEAFAMAEAAEMGGLDGVWLAERHFAAPRSPLDTGGAGIPSVVSRRRSSSRQPLWPATSGCGWAWR